MSRHDLIFDITYSYFLEKMFATINDRIDKLLSLIILGSCLGAFSDYAGLKPIATIIGGLSLIQIIYQFAKQAGIAQDQAKKYRLLSIEADDLNDQELSFKVKTLQVTDSNPWNILTNAAYNRACISLGLTDSCERLSFFEWLFARFSGEILKRDINSAKPSKRPDSR
ncbi:hypothetical protein OGY34_19890 [Citrobacter sp. Cy232]|uniref:hypothetical protein n=1 Tax=unclassified Citrobacter TaxID=2644389 RepID=UPI0019065443|nr:MULTISPECIES: hypothetical protein [unclassified Citrobacter]MBJ9883208.1 hypothetical protein [Citrobacter sp. FDAARGOS_156]MDM2718708.1 hypothetical protein [Citrobacter sp. Cy232]